MLSPAIVYTTVSFLGEPGLIFDLLALSFQVPTCASAARAGAPTTMHAINVSRILLVLMSRPHRLAIVCLLHLNVELSWPGLYARRRNRCDVSTQHRAGVAVA